MEQRVTPRFTVAAWAAVLAAAALAWVLTVKMSAHMAMPAMMPLPAFLVFWIVMMIAMMFPSVAPAALLWTRAIARTSLGAAQAWRMTQFLGGYLIAWAAFGTVLYEAILQVSSLLARRPESAGIAGAAIFSLAALYQATPLKRACLLHCRSPFAALMHYAAFPRRGRDLLVGLHHGAYCVGCCWGLMMLLLAAGIMNLAAMAGVALLVLLEKRWRRGEALARWSSALFALLALGALLRPDAFAGLR